MTTIKWKNLLCLLVVVFLALALKYRFSSVNADDLLWVLAPTAAAVDVVTGEEFEFESGAGYMNREKTFLIAASCSGVNFLIIAFLLLSIGRIWRNGFDDFNWRFIFLDGAIAYLVTIIANTVRIAGALQFHGSTTESGVFSAVQIHRIEGITVYFGFLLLLHFVSERFQSSEKSVKASFKGWVQSLMVPLGLYYLLLLAVPLLNGAYSQGFTFVEHAIFVFFVPLLLIMPFLVFRLTNLDIARRRYNDSDKYLFSHSVTREN